MQSPPTSTNNGSDDILGSDLGAPSAREMKPSIVLNDQSLPPEDPTQQEHGDLRDPPRSPLASHAERYVLPSSPAYSVYSDEWQWDEVFPEKIRCTLNLFKAERRKADQAHASRLLKAHDPEPVEWYKKKAYEELDETQNECIKKVFHDIGTKDLYIRHGLCRIIGKKHEAWKELDQSFKLQQTAITLICGFIRDYDHEMFSMEVFWEYATKQSKPRPRETYARTIQKELSSKMLRNFLGKEYIPRADLIKIMSAEVVKRIIDGDEYVQMEDWSPERRKNFFSIVQRRASRLQAVCVKQNLTMAFLEHLLQSELDDLNAPTEEWLEKHECEVEDCDTDLSHFLSAYYSFFPHKFDMDSTFREFSTPEVVPLYYSEPAIHYLGDGAASTVCKVNIDPVQHSLSTVCFIRNPALVR
jgi:hypothetical protein